MKRYIALFLMAVLSVTGFVKTKKQEQKEGLTVGVKVKSNASVECYGLA